MLFLFHKNGFYYAISFDAITLRKTVENIFIWSFTIFSLFFSSFSSRRYDDLFPNYYMIDWIPYTTSILLMMVDVWKTEHKKRTTERTKETN